MASKCALNITEAKTAQHCQKIYFFDIEILEMDLDAPGAIGIDHLNGGMLLSRSGSRTRGDSSSSKLSNRMESNYSVNTIFANLL